MKSLSCKGIALVFAFSFLIQFDEIDSLITPSATIRKAFGIKNHDLNFNKYYSKIASAVGSTMNNDESEESTETNNELAVQRTLYRMDPKLSSKLGNRMLYSEFQIEEQIFFQNDEADNEFVATGQKRYILRGPPNTAPVSPFSSASLNSNDDQPRRRLTRVGSPLFSLEMNEELPDTNSAVGTGGYIWESSVAMSLFLASHPDLLQGKVLELGSGVGLGGILSVMFASVLNGDVSQEEGNHNIPTFPSTIDSFTFTDNVPKLLKVCEFNAEQYIPRDKFHIRELDWYENDVGSGPDANAYNTIIGTECAYLFPDVKPLAETIASHLATSKSKAEGRSFILGPYNRDAMHYLQRQLKEGYQMSIEVGTIVMDSFDLGTVWCKDEHKTKDILVDGEDGSQIYLSQFQSKSNMQYLMIESMHHPDFLGGRDSEIFFRDTDLFNDQGMPMELQFETEQKTE